MKKEEEIKKYLNQYIDNFLKEASKKNNLDFFKIEINNHNGTLQIDHQFRSRDKIY